MSMVNLPEPDRQIIAQRTKISRDLRDLVGAEQVIDDVDGRRVFETDALTAYRRIPLVVVLPVNTEQVSLILRYCHDNNIKVVARGAGTSLSGGAVPSEDAVVVSLSRMKDLLAIDLENRCAQVQAGLTNLAISDAVAAKGFFYAPDPASRIACTIAGNIATNASGTRSLKYGGTTQHVIGIRIVMMDGEIIDLGGRHLDAPGYEFMAMIVGSEGQFGIVTEATVRLTRLPEEVRPMLLGFDDATAAINAAKACVGAGLVPVALDFMDKSALLSSEAFSQAGYPTDAECILIIELEGVDEEVDQLIARVAELCKPFAPNHVRAAETAADCEAIWKGRRAAFGAFGKDSDYCCLDGTIPVGRLPDVLPVISDLATHHDLKVATLFHAGAGNLHVVVQYDANDPEQVARMQACSTDVLRLCIESGGTLSAEHGIGLEKRDLMPLQFTETDIAVQMRVKTIFDPNWLLNPSKMFPSHGRSAPTGAG